MNSISEEYRVRQREVEYAIKHNCLTTIHNSSIIKFIQYLIYCVNSFFRGDYLWNQVMKF